MTHADRNDRDRWIASGLPDAVVTIMFRDGTLPPPHAVGWYDSSLTTAEVTEYRRAGRPAPDLAFASSLESRGLPTDSAFIAAWQGFDAGRILDAIDRGFTSGEQFAPWAETDADITEVEQLAVLGSTQRFDPAKALALLRSGRTPEEIAFSLDSGLKAKKSRGWMNRGLSAATAKEWSAAGFSASKAEQWVEVVHDPEVARLLESSLGFDVDTAREQRPEGGWTTHVVRRQAAVAAGAPDDLADEWASTSLPDRKLAVWVAAGVRPGDVAAWRGVDFGPGPASVWAAQGFSPDDASAWRNSGVDPDIAARRRDVGVRPPAIG
jgi:hypothetical protein